MTTPHPSIDSEALRANTPAQQPDVVLPPSALALQAAVEPYVGVHAGVSETLHEYFHPYRNRETLVAGVSALQLRYWPYLDRHADRVAHVDRIADLALDLLDDGLNPVQYSALLRATLTWCKDLAAGAGAADVDAGLARVVDHLAATAEDHLTELLERDTLLRDLTRAAAALPLTGPATARLDRHVLLGGYGRLRERLDVPAWARSSDAGLVDGEAIASRFAMLAGDEIARHESTVRDAADAAVPGLPVPTYSQLLSSALGELPRTTPLEDRFAVDLFLLKDDSLGYRMQSATSDLLAVVKQLVKPGREEDVTERVLTRLTAFFRGHSDEFALMRLQCYEAIGVAIGLSGNVRAADHLLEDLVSWSFQYPEISGTTDEWETLVNPNHLPTIRCWMKIIESNPALYERLAAALNVHLRLGGVHIADTDLFQRDVSRFLNSDIRPIYFVAKQLLRVFPVYYHEVGAEGELRAASTQFDEINARRDTLLHFLRKQVHAESSNRLVPFSREVVRYWLTLDKSGLAPYVSENTLHVLDAERCYADGPHALLVALREVRGADLTDDELVDDLLAGDHEELLAWLLSHTDVSGDAYRLARLVRTHQLLKHKYQLTSDDAPREVNAFMSLAPELRSNFEQAHAAWADGEGGACARDALLRATLDVLLKLKEIILDPEPTEASEQLYHKRHIAAGIPSIYGNYREPKFDALSLSLRLETLAARLLEDIVNEGVEPYVTRDTLRRMAGHMALFERALNIDGVASQSFGDVLRMFEASFSFYSFTFHQHHNIFQMLARAMSDLSSRSVRSHGQILRIVLANDPRQAQLRGLSEDGVAELVLRDVLVSGLGIQALDRYVGQALRKMTTLHEQLGASALTRMMNYDPERLVWPLHDQETRRADLPTLGFKGFGLCQMAAMGIHVPEGFVLSTELFHASEAMTYRPLYDDTVRRVREALTDLEAQTGRRLGDPAQPLLLSVRSGSPISMPGLMTTFVNVGLTDANADDFAARPGFEWGTWDSYRRFVQSWAMAHEIERDVFHGIMQRAKDRHGVRLKYDFSAEQMRDIAREYKEAAQDHGVPFFDDPFDQLMASILKVVDSWDADDPKLYRAYTDVAENWGTAVTCQRMVFGNLSRESGSGVVFTTNPLEPYSHQVRLFGDFAVASQGEDLVGGLVFPLPISESQRRGSAAYQAIEKSMETEFPELYEALLEVAHTVAGGSNNDPQEIEFTFESPTREGLYILQKRAVVPEQQVDAPYFDLSGGQATTPTAAGMGVSGGAYVGRVAFSGDDVDALLAEDENEPIILIRPDTVPEDLALIARVDGVLTARGGATSHAAVTAKRLAKTAVCGCHELQVFDKQHRAEIAGHEVRRGDWVSIDGRNGSIYVARLNTVAKPLPGQAS